MTQPAIKVEALSKEYIVGQAAKRDGTFYELLTRTLTAPLKRLRNLGGQAQRTEKFWALQDVNFEVQPGEVVGIIGRNGAGKSTLLKILSRITEPTKGKAVLRGRVASLLEVGTGFHGELTGRENIFLNGAILGMTKSEIERHFDAIVAFSEVEKFLDTPVKRYSSGMYVRLAFAVAAHIDPEILIVDEVLAVGDRQFQEKCLSRMHDISGREGKTVLFVSHNLEAVERICSSGIYLSEGRISYQGPIKETIQQYFWKRENIAQGFDLGGSKERWGSGIVKIIGVQVQDAKKGEHVEVLQAGNDYQFLISYAMQDDTSNVSNVYGSIEFSDQRGTTVLLASSIMTNKCFNLAKKRGQVICSINDFNLAPGDYLLTLYLGRRSGDALDCLKDILRITVVGGDYFGSGHPGLPEFCRTLTRSDWVVPE